MKCSIPEISWHNREPVLSVDIHPVSTDLYKLASGGADCHVVIWQLVLNEKGFIKPELLSDLTRHQRAINSVRWSPTGQYLATADDDGNIIVWQLKTDNIPPLGGETTDNKEIWNAFKTLRGHKEDIYDLCWSADGLKLFSGSVDNTAILWDIKQGKMDRILSDHKGFVQGVAWDPKNQLLASISSDRICRIFDVTGKQVKARFSKGKLPILDEKHFLFEKEVKYFHDDTFKSFFRRLQFSPDGSFLVVPSGHCIAEDGKESMNATLVFSFESLTSPVALFPHLKECSTVVRFCPMLFELREDGPEPFIDLPYRMILAIGTDHDVVLYDTQQCCPFARFQEIHYTRLTDLTWSDDGRILIASSTDGFCALITFEPEELGVKYVEPEVEESVVSMLDISGCEEFEKDENVDSSNKEPVTVETPKKPSFMDKWALKTPKQLRNERSTEDDDLQIVEQKISVDIPQKKNNAEASSSGFEKEKINVLVPRRKSVEPVKSKENKPINVLIPKAKVDAENKKESPAAAKAAEVINVLIPKRKPQTPKTLSVEEPVATKRKSPTVNVLIPKRKKDETKLVKDKNETKSETLSKASDNTTENGNITLINNGSSDSTSDKSKALKVTIDNSKTNSIQEEPLENILNEKKLLVINVSQEDQTIVNTIANNIQPEISDDSKKTSNIIKPTANKKSGVKRKLDTSSPKTPIKIKLKIDETKAETTPKRDKISTPPMKQKNEKPKASPAAKNNSLLNFLKRSAEKPKPPAKKAEPILIDLTENEARDSWSCEKNKTTTEEVADVKDKEIGAIVHIDRVIENKTEDFVLQLEETQPEPGVVVVGTDVPVKRQESDDSNDSKSSVKSVVDTLMKVPRRVALITLSSPKGKQKP